MPNEMLSLPELMGIRTRHAENRGHLSHAINSDQLDSMVDELIATREAAQPVLVTSTDEVTSSDEASHPPSDSDEQRSPEDSSDSSSPPSQEERGGRRRGGRPS